MMNEEGIEKTEQEWRAAKNSTDNDSAWLGFIVALVLLTAFDSADLLKAFENKKFENNEVINDAI